MSVNNACAVFVGLLLTGATSAIAAAAGKSTAPVSVPSPKKLAAIYTPKPGACYVLLKPNWEGMPHVEGGDYPVCQAVLGNLNKFCDEPPQYERRKLHPTTKDLSEPKWEQMDVKANLELVKQTYGAPSLPEYRESRWEGKKERVLSLAKSGALRLSHADISLSAKGGIQTVYKLDNANPGEKLVGYNQSRLMFSEQGKQSPFGPFDGTFGFADIWRVRNSWYLIRYDMDTYMFIVDELSWADPELRRVANIPRCSIQHTNDRQGDK